MIHEVLTPGVQDADEAYAGAKMLRIVREFHECFGHRTEQKIIHDLLIHDDNGIELRRDSEDDVEVLNGQQVFVSGLNPLFFLKCLAFRTVPVPA